MGNYFSEKQEVTHPTPAPPLHGRGVAGAHELFRSLDNSLVVWGVGRLGDCPTRMAVQRSRDDHIWRLTAKNAVTRMAIHDSLHETRYALGSSKNYMFFFSHE